MARQDKSTARQFEGFDRPESNWFRMPNSWTDMTAGINSIAELKVVEYILRHTWGYQEYEIKKHITIDEFVSGRRRQDGSRMDTGTGLSERAVYDGIRKAVEDRLIEEETDSSDRGRVKKFFSLRMRDSASKATRGLEMQDLQSGVQSLQGRVQSLPPRGAKSAPRSEKETQERFNTSNIRNASANLKRTEEHTANESVGLVEADRRNKPGSALKGVETIAAAIASSAVARTVDEHQPPVKAVATAAARNDGVPGGAAEREVTSPSAPGRGRLRRVPHQDEVYQVIQSYIADFSRELNDKAPLKTSTTRAYHLYQRSGLSQQGFIDQLYAARAIVKEQTGNIRSQGEHNAAGFPVKHKAAYWFAVLEQLLGLRDDDDGALTGNVEATAPSQSLASPRSSSRKQAS